MANFLIAKRQKFATTRGGGGGIVHKRIIAGNKKIVVGPPQRTENYQFGQIPPHGTITEMQIGFIR